jgi:hypothetical protein
VPKGFDNCEEAQLHKAEAITSDAKAREKLLNWWLAVPDATRTTTPNWDISYQVETHEVFALDSMGRTYYSHRVGEYEFLLQATRCVISPVPAPFL